MSREILYRGQSLWGKHKWLFGSLVKVKTQYYILPTDFGGNWSDYEVLIDTIGQFIIHNPIQNQNFFEDDILRAKNGRVGYIVWEGFEWMVHTKKTAKEVKQFGIEEDEDCSILFRLSDWYYKSVVVGNISKNNYARVKFIEQGIFKNTNTPNP